MKMTLYYLTLTITCLFSSSYCHLTPPTMSGTHSVSCRFSLGPNATDKITSFSTLSMTGSCYTRAWVASA